MRVIDWVVLTLKRVVLILSAKSQGRPGQVAPLPACFCSHDNLEFLELHLWAVRCGFFTTDLGCAFKLTNCLGDNWSLTLDGVNLVLKICLQNMTWLDYTPPNVTSNAKPPYWLNLYVSLHSFKGANSPRGEFFNPDKMLGYRLPKLKEYVAKKTKNLLPIYVT